MMLLEPAFKLECEDGWKKVAETKKQGAVHHCRCVSGVIHWGRARSEGEKKR